MANVIFEEGGGGVARITLQRAGASVALTRAMLERLANIFCDVGARNDLRAVVLYVAGVVPSAVTVIEEVATLDDDAPRIAAERLRSVSDLIESCRVPVIAAVSGLAAGAEFEVVLACHIRIASADARFNLLQTNQGETSAYVGIQRLTSLGCGRPTIEKLLRGEDVMAGEALHSGLVNRVVAPEQVVAEAERIAHEIARLAPLAIEACLQAVLRGSEMTLEEGLELEAKLFSSLFATEDVREGTSAFLEKRSPVFKGQ